MTLPLKQSKDIHWVTLLLSLLVVAIGTSVLLGWVFDIAALKAVFPGLVTMKANTAMGLLLCGLALAFVSREKAGSKLRFCIATLAGIVIALGSLTLGEYFFGWNLGIDELLFRDAIQSVGTSQPGRMSPSTAFCFVVAGSDLLVASTKIVPRLKFSLLSGLSATLMLIGGVACLGQISNGLFQFRLWNYFGMAVHTAAGFVLLGGGLLALVKSEGEMTWALDKMTTIGFATAIAIMLTVAGVSWNYTNQLEKAAAWVSHTQEVLKEVEEVRGGMADLESSQRGYIITGDERLLAQRTEIKNAVLADIDALRELSAGNPGEQQHLDELAPLTVSRTDFGEQTIVARRAQGFSAAQQMITTGTGIGLTKNINRLLLTMRDDQYGLLVTRQKEVNAVSTTTFLLLPVGVFLSLTILSLALFFLNMGVAERAQAEEVAAQLAAIVNSSNDAIIGKDLNSIVTSWNIGAEKLFGYSAKEMIGSPITRLIPPERQQEEMQIIARIRHGETLEHFDTVRAAKDGHPIDIAVTVSPIKDKTGKIVGASKVARDITERKRAEEMLRRQAAIIDLSPDAIIVRDLDGKIISWSRGAENLYGWTKEEVLGRATHSLFETRFSEPLEKIMEQFEKTGRWSGELVHHTKNGREITVQSWWLAEVNALDKRMGMLESNIDITERKLAEQEIHELNTRLEERVVERTAELEAANKELEAFSYSVSHDLRAPLRAVDGFAQAVVEDYGPQLPEEGQRYLQTIREGAQRMGTLIDDLLTFSRLSRTPLNKQEVNTGEMVRHVLESLNFQREGRQVEIRIGDMPACQGDPALLNQVWINLISNALKYTRKCETAVIEIGCKLEQDEHVYFVRDNGAGFDMRYVHKLFGVFQRLHRANEFEGTGVGLAIVQRIIHRHGGRIWADAAVDRGATFYFTLKERTPP